jgi:uncharacterized SAM-binding protein YcdF (DUF218 family)
MRDFLSILIMPLSIMWLLILMAGILFLLKKKRTASCFVSISLLWLLTISTGFIPVMLVDSLENQYPPLNITDDLAGSTPVYIMVLGHGYTNDKKLPHIDQLSANSLFRLMEGIRIHQLISGSKIVFSWGEVKASEKYSDAMSQAAISLGVDTSFIKKINRVKNTKDEAERFYSTFGRKGSLIIVTDAVHMPRAMKLFRKAGLDPIASPTNHLNKLDPDETRFLCIPSASNIYKMEIAVHEYAGMIWNLAGGY